eukprot:TRINITY_DN1223_c0_g2_i7.p1 TRINITY_DN1223_c0_g2~~TRINITY_DN1223_c0_g2_i7.p1  ORF type:complete len:277 (+),score=41.83 TRINITY_DN1223_c0_g2_i7:105-935(+)
MWTTDRYFTCNLWGNVHEFYCWSGAGVLADPSFISFKLLVRAPTGPTFDLDSPMNVRDWVEEILCAVASTGKEHVVVLKKDIPTFINTHRGSCFVTHNVEFEWMALLCYLKGIDENIWETCLEVVNQGRLRDVLILDALVRLAVCDDSTTNRPLESVLADYHPLYQRQDPDSRDVHVFGRYHYSTTLSVSQDTTGIVHDPIVLDAIKDVIVILPVYRSLCQKAVALMNRYPHEIYSHSLLRYGPLSESIQVKGTVALTQIEMNGMFIDQKQLEKVC